MRAVGSQLSRNSSSVIMSFMGSNHGYSRKVLPAAIIKKSNSSAMNSCPSVNNANGISTQPYQAITQEKPLNIMVSIDEDVLLEQQQLEATLRPTPPIGSGPLISPATIPSPLSPPGTSWISSHVIFRSLKRQLVKLIGPSRFAIYPITTTEIKSKPWQGTTALLILLIKRTFKDEDDYLVDAEKAIKEFINNGGLAVVYKLNELFQSTDVYTEHGLQANFFKERLISKVGKQFFAAPNRVIKFEDDDVDKQIPKVTPAYLVTCDDYKELLGAQFISDINSNPRSKIKLLEEPPCPAAVLDGAVEEEEEDDENNKEVSPDSLLLNGLNGSFDHIPVILNHEHIPSGTKFDFEQYYEHLTSNRLGNHIIYQEVSPSTQTLIEPFTNLDGLVVVARQQTQGKGRGENQWISPPGCAMFSIHLTVGLSSKLGQRLGFVQHLMALAVVKAVKGIAGCEDLDLKLKWPNDIYFSNKSKLGGIVVQSVLRGHNVHCFIGTGINISNSSPSTCINDILKSRHQAASPTSNNGSSDNDNVQSLSLPSSESPTPPQLTTEVVIARTISELDSLVKKFERNGVEWAKEVYTSHWMHHQQLVRIANTKQVLVEGLDDQGYLMVRDTQSGLLMSVHPDGNRFDMLHNLLVLKKNC